MNLPPQEPLERPDSPQAVSLEKRIPQPPLPSQQSTRLIWWCRVFLWISPVPTWVILCAGLEWLGYNHFAATLGMAILSALGIGYCDAFLSPSVTKKNGTPVPNAAISHSIVFGTLQIIIAPLCLITLIFLLNLMRSI